MSVLRVLDAETLAAFGVPRGSTDAGEFTVSQKGFPFITAKNSSLKHPASVEMAAFKNELIY